MNPRAPAPTKEVAVPPRLERAGLPGALSCEMGIAK
jgi:hypothetical protein